MNSLLITNTFLPRIGGRENYCHHLFSRFDTGQVVIVTPDHSGEYEQFDREYTLPVFRIGNLSRTWFLRKRRSRAKWLCTLATICWRHQIDVVHCGLVLPDGLSGWLLRETLGKPYIVYTYGKEILENQRHPRLADRMRLALSSASRVVSISSYTEEKLREFGLAPEKLARIPPAVDANRLAAGMISDRVEELRRVHGLSDRPVILTVGRLIERKGCDKVIESLPVVLSHFPQAVYLIVGDGPDRSRLEKLRNSLGLENAVIFTGFVPEDDLPAYYKLATLFAMVSRQTPGSHEVEGFGLVYLEANACGLPVVAGRTGGVPDAVLDGRTGYLIDPFSEEEIAAAIIRLLENPQLCEELGSFGRERAINEFSWQQFSQRLQKLTKEVGAEMPRRSFLSTIIHTLPAMFRRDIFTLLDDQRVDR